MLQALIDHGPGMWVASLPRARHALHVMPTSAGHERREGGSYDWHGLKRGTTPFTILQYTIAGSGNLRFEDRHFRAMPGQAMLLTVPHDHRYWLGAGEAWEYFWLSMSGAEALRIHALAQQAAGPLVALAPATVDRLASLCLRLMQGEGNRPGAASAIAYEAAMALFDDVLGAAAPGTTEPAIARVLSLVAAHPGRSFEVDMLARHAGLSRAHFSRLFASVTGRPPAEYVLAERLRHAARLLATDPALSVKAAAGHAGFADANYFSKAFRRMFGASPGQFRASGMYFDPSRPDRNGHGSP